MTSCAGIDVALRRWKLGALLRCDRLAAGRTNDSFRVETGQGTFVVRRSRVSKAPGAIVFEHDLSTALACEGLPVPEIMRDPTGASFMEIEGRLWTVTRFVAGRQPERTESAARLGGRTLARFHAAARAVRGHPELPPDEDRVAASRACLDACETAASLDPDVAALVARTRSVVEATATAIATSAGDLAHIVIHGSCRLTSLLVDGDTLAAVLDLDGSRLGTRAQDTAIAFASFAKCRDGLGALDRRLAAAFIEGYLSADVLTRRDKQALPGYVAQALLYAWTRRLERALSVTPIDRADLARSLWRLASAEHAITARNLEICCSDAFFTQGGSAGHRP